MINADSVDAASAAVVAARFLERDGCDCENPGPHCPQLGNRHFEYLAGDDSTVYEFPLVHEGFGSGYIVISGSRKLPPVLEFCPVGSPLREKLLNCLSGFTHMRALEIRSLKWRYFGPLDIVAELALTRGGYVYVRLPNLRVKETIDRIRIHAPRSEGQQKWIEDRWRYYDDRVAPKGTLSCGKMFGIRPIKYNQTCESSLHQADAIVDTGPNYCTPSCIAGCVATGWAVLAGAWKGAATYGSEKLFRDAPDWGKDWSSSYGGPPPPGSQAVNRRMWAVHGYLGTSCSGNTQDRQTIAGSRIFSDYGVNWAWRSRFAVDYAFASSINKAGQPGLLTAQSVWIPNEPPEGHGIVTHGWNDNDQHISLCLGWGSSFPDKWIAFSILCVVNAFFVSHFQVFDATDDIDPSIPAAVSEMGDHLSDR